MRRITIVKYTFADGWLHAEGLDIVALTEEEYDVLKELLASEGYRELPTS